MTELGSESCVVLDHEALVSVDPDMVLLRVKGRGHDAVYIGTTAERAARLGHLLIAGALRLDPKLAKPKAVETAADASDVEGAAS